MKTPATHGDPSHQAIIDRLEAVIRENTRDLIGHFQQGQSHQDKRMDSLEKDMQVVKQDIGLMKNAIVELANNERHLRNLVHHLQREGIKISDLEVFAT